jgi:hypothetical protein
MTINVLNSPLIFHRTKNTNNPPKKQMKKLPTQTSIFSAMAVLALMSACQTTDTSQASPQKEALLAQSGFKVITVTTPQQQQAVTGLAQGRVSAVKYNGKLYYVYPTSQKDRFYVGKQKHFNAYKQALAAQQAGQPAQPGQQQINPPPTMTYETAGPHHIEVNQFNGFGPMGTASLGNW